MSNISIYSKSFLSPIPSPQEDIIKEAVLRASSQIKNVPHTTILKQNPYEQMIPFNLWYRNQFYRVLNNYQNNQNLRIRSYKSATLTPVVSVDNQNLTAIQSFLSLLSLYQPFYPETFYGVWEFLKLDHLNSNARSFLYMGREERLGSMEAIIFYMEKYQHKYQHNTYHCWLSGKEIYNKFNRQYGLMVPEINYLEQAYKVIYLRNSANLIKYDFICIDAIHIFRDIFIWNNEEADLHATIFYFIQSLKHLTDGGSVLIRLNAIGRKAWSIIFDIGYRCFSEYTFFRPSTLNNFNSEIYLFLTKFNGYKNSIRNDILQNLYRQKTYRKLYLNFQISPKNPIYQKYLISLYQWCQNLSTNLSLLHTVKAQTIEIIDFNNHPITKWHRSNDLAQIGDLKPVHDDKAIQFIISTKAKKVEIKPPKTCEKLYNLPSYKKLIKERANLNYYKRVMDTKPSNIFKEDGRYTDYNNKLLTWEQLTNKIEIYHKLKYVLRTQYGAETVTNAWIKMYEILNLFPDLLPPTKNVKTFSLCEAPGAFVSAINHYLSTHNQNLNWYAQTLRKTNCGTETDAALDDYFGLIKKYPNRWLFGDEQAGETGDQSGDITHSTVIKSYAKNSLLESIDFMTADAGLQCDPSELNEQETYLGKINMGQIICILACLPAGKSAIFKTFLPMSEPLTISMVYLVTHLFTTVSVVKPSSSHGANSEVYLVLRNYKGISQTFLEKLYILLDSPDITSKSLLVPEIDKTFLQSYMVAATSLIDRQISSLTRNYYYYYHLDQIQNFESMVDTCTDNWIRLNPIFVLKDKLI